MKRFQLYTTLLHALASAGLAQTVIPEVRQPGMNETQGTTPGMGDWRSRYHKGERLLIEGRTEEALSELKPALAKAGAAGRGALLDALGRAEFQAGRYRDAKRHWEASVPMWELHSPQWARALSNLGRAYLELQEHAHAETVFLQALEVLKSDARLWQNLGQAQFVRGRRREAEESYRTALLLADRKQVPSIACDLAGLLETKRQHAKAAEILREAISQERAGQVRARMLLNLGGLLWQLKEKSQALTQIRSALTEMESAVGPQHPDVAAILDRYQELLRKSGQKAESVVVAQRAAAIRSSFVRYTSDRGTSVDWRDLK